MGKVSAGLAGGRGEAGEGGLGARVCRPPRQGHRGVPPRCHWPPPPRLFASPASATGQALLRPTRACLHGLAWTGRDERSQCAVAACCARRHRILRPPGASEQQSAHAKRTSVHHSVPRRIDCRQWGPRRVTRCSRGLPPWTPAQGNCRGREDAAIACSSPSVPNSCPRRRQRCPQNQRARRLDASVWGMLTNHQL